MKLKETKEIIKKLKKRNKNWYIYIYIYIYIYKVDCPDKKPTKCEIWKECRIYPFHFKDDNGELYRKEYFQGKQKCKSLCCMDCFHKAEERNLKKQKNKKNFAQPVIVI